MSAFSRILKINPYSEPSRNPCIVNELKKYLKTNDRVVDIGCGNGRISFELKKIKNVRPMGVDNHVKTNLIPFIRAKGEKLPFKNREFDASILIDVLHHTDDMRRVLKEASRVSKRVVIKDHFYETISQKVILSTIDFLANMSYGVPVPFNFLTLKEWKQLFESLDMKIIKMNKDFKLGRFDVIKHVFFVLK